MFARFSNNVSGRSPSGLVVELLMIVIGINVALWFEGWFEDRRERETEAQYLVELRDDLASSIGDLDAVIKLNTAKTERLQAIVADFDAIKSADQQNLARVIFEPSSYSFFEPVDATYQALLESGDFRLLENSDIKKGLLGLSRRWSEIETLQGNYLQALDDGYIPLMMGSFDIIGMELTDPGLLDRQVFRNFFPYALQDIERLVWFYKETREQTQALINLIEADE